MRALAIAATGMQAQQTNVETIANNIANTSTTGFKRQRAEFQDLMYESASRVGTQSSEAGTVLPTGTQRGLGVRAGAINRINIQGSLTQTENKLDLAIEGKGFFGVQMPDRTVAYTRDGNFKLSPEGQIVNSEGYAIEPGIRIDTNAKEININQSGEVIVTSADGRQTTAGRLNLYIFANDAGLEAIGGNKFLESPASGDAVAGLPTDPGYGNVRQGWLEASNVNVVQEITQLISAQRAYEMNSKVIEAGDQMMATVNQIR